MAAALVFLLGAGICEPSDAATITVATLADASGNGNCSLRDAITTANGTAVAGSGCATASAANTIVFARGLSGTILLGSTLPDIESNLTISGPARGGIAISGQNAVGVMTIDLSGTSGYTVTLSNLTVENGNGVSFGAGGAILNTIATLNVDHCVFLNNYASQGGAIFDAGGLLTVTNSTFSKNSAGDGGAILVETAFPADVTNCTISNSSFSANMASAGGGGALFIEGGTVQTTGSTFSGNNAANGGAIYDGAPSPYALNVANCRFSSNTADTEGGAIDDQQANLTITGSLISTNRVSNGSGGGLLLGGGGTVTVLNSNILSNTAGAGGGGIYNSLSGALSVSNSTVAFNSAAENGGGILNVGNIVSIEDCSVSKNNAGGSGGAIENAGLITVDQSLLNANTAGANGGAIDNFAAGSLTDSSVHGNSAGSSGGSIFNEPGSTPITVSDSSISGNSPPP
jgi:CSLREA domain-containing protein